MCTYSHVTTPQFGKKKKKKRDVVIMLVNTRDGSTTAALFIKFGRPRGHFIKKIKRAKSLL